MKRVQKLIYLLLMILSDVFILFVSFLLAFFIRIHILPAIFPSLLGPFFSLSSQLRHGFFYSAFIVIIIFIFEKLYVKRFTFWDETRHLLKGLTLSFALIMTTVFILRSYEQYSRAVIVVSWALSLVLFPSFRLIVRKFFVKTNLWKKKVVILGTGEMAKSAAQEIIKNPVMGYEIVGFLTDDKKRIGKNLGGYKILGEIHQLEKLAPRLGIKDIIIALPKSSQQELISMMRQCEKKGETIRIIPSMGNLFTIGVEIENIGDILSLSVARNLIKPWNIFLKSAFEFTLAIFLSVLFLPVFLATALAIKVSSPGPAIYVQERLGKRNKIFKFYKFRSMFVDSDTRLEAYLRKNPNAQKEWEKYQKIRKNDPRVTGVGKFIRKFSIDELPQLINFFKGEMNLVGPRPYLPREKKKIGRSYEIISQIKPGITGLWQVRGRNILTFKERLLNDEYYVRNWSLWLDIVILVKTVNVFITRQGAY